MSFGDDIFNSKTEKNWRDMLLDAPSGYCPHFMGTCGDEKLAAHFQKLYMQLRRDSDNGNGVSLMRDLVLRRIVWSVRILERVEQAIEYWDHQVSVRIKEREHAEGMLVGYMQYHTKQSRQLNESIELILVEMPPMKTVEQISGRSTDRDKVTFSETEGGGEDYD